MTSDIVWGALIALSHLNCILYILRDVFAKISFVHGASSQSRWLDHLELHKFGGVWLVWGWSPLICGAFCKNLFGPKSIYRGRFGRLRWFRKACLSAKCGWLNKFREWGTSTFNLIYLDSVSSELRLLGVSQWTWELENGWCWLDWLLSVQKVWLFASDWRFTLKFGKLSLCLEWIYLM